VSSGINPIKIVRIIISVISLQVADDGKVIPKNWFPKCKDSWFAACKYSS